MMLAQLGKSKRRAVESAIMKVVANDLKSLSAGKGHTTTEVGICRRLCLKAGHIRLKTISN